MLPHRARLPSGIPELDWVTTDDGSLTLWDANLQETYHSGCGAVAESLIVYLVNSNIYHQIANHQPVSVFELGLGTGTNLLLTAALAEHFSVQLDYWSIEKRLLPTSVYKNLDLVKHIPQAVSKNSDSQQSLRDKNRPRNSRMTSLPCLNDLRIATDHFEMISEISDRLVEWIDQNELEGVASSSLPSRKSTSLPSHTFPATLQHQTCQLSTHCTFHLLMGDALDLPSFNGFHELSQRFTALYFDPFSPETNPELWTEEFLSAMYQILRTGGILTSYCVKSEIRRRLQKIGFTVFKISGPPEGKREVLQAVK